LITDDYINIALYRIEEKIQSWDKDIPKIVSRQKLFYQQLLFFLHILLFINDVTLSNICYSFTNKNGIFIWLSWRRWNSNSTITVFSDYQLLVSLHILHHLIFD
jgi:hypothetical protein